MASIILKHSIFFCWIILAHLWNTPVLLQTCLGEQCLSTMPPFPCVPGIQYPIPNTCERYQLCTAPYSVVQSPCIARPTQLFNYKNCTCQYSVEPDECYDNSGCPPPGQPPQYPAPAPCLSEPLPCVNGAVTSDLYTCQEYHLCVNGQWEFEYCPPGLYFNGSICQDNPLLCTHIAAPCVEYTTTTTTEPTTTTESTITIAQHTPITQQPTIELGQLTEPTTSIEQARTTREDIEITTHHVPDTTQPPTTTTQGTPIPPSCPVEKCIPFNPPFPCTPAFIHADPFECKNYRVCVAPYEFILKACPGAEEFNYLACECNTQLTLEECYDTGDCDPITGTPPTIPDPEPCLSGPLPCVNGTITHDIYFCYTYFLCVNEEWESQNCPQALYFDGDKCQDDYMQCSHIKSPVTCYSASGLTVDGVIEEDAYRGLRP